MIGCAKSTSRDARLYILSYGNSLKKQELLLRGSQPPVKPIDAERQRSCLVARLSAPGLMFEMMFKDISLPIEKCSDNSLEPSAKRRALSLHVHSEREGAVPQARRASRSGVRSTEMDSWIPSSDHG
ncbi:hypothetical protein H4Q26_008708 [Puccinia striiformis f. sp. tritici PST-130]|nr:hypothetical protein H4Q26_008708 [Puccinia striiformis f. sp. tritici PST-130]